MEKCLSSTPVKNEEKNMNVLKIVGANLQCVNNNWAKFEYQGMNTVGVTDFTTRHHLSIADGKYV